MSSQDQHLGHMILAHRRKKELTQQGLAEQIGISRASIASWETGRSKPSDEQLGLLADKLEMETNLLKPPTFEISEEIERVKNVCLNELGSVTSDLSNKLLEATFDLALPIKDLDKRANESFKGFIKKHIAPEFDNGIILFSEEELDRNGNLKPIVIRKNGVIEEDKMDFTCEHYIVLDPLDRSTEAVRSIAGFSHFSVCSFKDGFLFSIICLLFDPYIMFYYAVRGQGAFIRTKNSQTKPLYPGTVRSLPGACIGAYVGKPSRLELISYCKKLFERQKEESVFVNVSGSYGFALAASGQIDGFFEITKGYRWHDIIAGAHVLQEAGGVVKGLDFEELDDPFSSEFFNITGRRLEEFKNKYNSNIPPKVLEGLNNLAFPDDQNKRKEKNYKSYGEILQFLAKLGTNNMDERIQVEKLMILICNFFYDLPEIKNQLNKRQRFVSASTYELGAQICIELAKNEFPFKEWDEKYNSDFSDLGSEGGTPQSADEKKTGSDASEGSAAE
jgi:fructose-1,6-bisphosphatase/inositol monophosphatase family enzyme/transcriptional regulator with XRE-family HTH domain